MYQGWFVAINQMINNISVLAMVTGAAAAQPPRPGEGLFAPGCIVGNRAFTP